MLPLCPIPSTILVRLTPDEQQAVAGIAARIGGPPHAGVTPEEAIRASVRELWATLEAAEPAQDVPPA